MKLKNLWDKGIPILIAVLFWATLATACRNGEVPSGELSPSSDDKSPTVITEESFGEAPLLGPINPSWQERREERERMVSTQIERRGIKDPRVLQGMRKVPRHLFVPKGYQYSAYADHPLSIGKGQTISQPYIVALMTELLCLKPNHKVLEIGTGSGYQAAILGELVKAVYTIEIVKSLGEMAKIRLKEMGYKNIEVRIGDGYKGWPEAAPFDAIIVTAAPDHVPPSLKKQLKEGGRLVIPVGKYSQELKLITRTKDGFEEKTITYVLFVPMTGKAQE